MATDFPKKFGSWVNNIEETFIALILGLMTMLTFANVVARYVFNSNILWALETTVFLFAWLVLIGASYCVKTRAHLGVDLLLKALPSPINRMVAILAVLACVAFSVLLLFGILGVLGAVCRQTRLLSGRRHRDA